jgi:putative glutamine amidotransferase
VLNAAAGGLLDIDLAATDVARALHAGPDRSQPVHRVRPVPGTRFAAIVGESPFAVNSQHRQGLATVGERARACALAEDGLVEAIECPGLRFCMGVQWHPEFTLGEADRALLRGFVSAAVSTRPSPSP